MKSFLCAVAALSIAGAIQARPVVLEEAIQLAPPDDSWQYFGRFGVAIDGDFALVSGQRWIDDPESPTGRRHEGAALLYQRVGAAWAFVGTLGPSATVTEWVSPGLAMKDGVAMVIIDDRPRIFERAGTTWSESPIAARLVVQGRDIEIDNGRILVPELGCNFNSLVLRKMNGAWDIEGELPGHTNGCGDSPPSPLQDLQGTRAAVMNPPGNSFEPPTLRHYRLEENGVGWREERTFEDTSMGVHVAMSGDYTAFNRNVLGTEALFLQEGSERSVYFPLAPVDTSLHFSLSRDVVLERVGQLFAQRKYDHDRRAYVFHLYRMDEGPEGFWSQVATLRALNNASLGGPIDASGNRVIVSGHHAGPGGSLSNNTVRIFELPSTFEPAPVKAYDFEGPSAAVDWQPTAGSSFFVTTSGGTRVYRQPSTAGTPASFASESARNQSIQAEITLRTFSGNDRWVGLATRRRDDSNYYYVALRTSGVVELKRMVRGVITTLASAPATLRIGAKVRIRLESIGITHRVYIDDQPVLYMRDSWHREGQAGIVMNRAAADYDNVIVSPTPFASIYVDDFSSTAGGGWSLPWRRANGVLRQPLTHGHVRTTVGGQTDDQVVQVRVRALGFTEPDAWVGLQLRHNSPYDHVYVSLHGRGVISLWRRTNGVIQQLDTRAIPVSVGTWYTLRAEVVNDVTRVFVNDRLQFTTSASLGPSSVNAWPGKGQVGLSTYKASAEFDDFLAYQP